MAAARRAITSLEGPLIVLLGGKDKDEDFSPLVSALVDADARVFAYGEAGPRIQQALAERVQVELIGVGFDAVVPGRRRRGEAGRRRAPLSGLFELRHVRELRGAW